MMEQWLVKRRCTKIITIIKALKIRIDEFYKEYTNNKISNVETLDKILERIEFDVKTLRNRIDRYKKEEEKNGTCN